MLSKEEIEKNINTLKKDITKPLSCGDIVIVCIEDVEAVLQYIEQQELDKQKLIDKLEEYIRLVNCGEILSIRSTLKEILEILKGETNE